MENFFDVATLEEVEEFFEDITPEEITEMEEFYKKAPDANCQRLFELYLMRGDKKTAFYYYDKISEGTSKLTLYNIAYKKWETLTD